MDLNNFLLEMEEELPVADDVDSEVVDSDMEAVDSEEYAINGKFLITDYSPTTSKLIILPNARRQIMRVDFKEVRKSLKASGVDITSSKVAKIFKETLKYLGLAEGEE